MSKRGADASDRSRKALPRSDERQPEEPDGRADARRKCGGEQAEALCSFRRCGARWPQWSRVTMRSGRRGDSGPPLFALAGRLPKPCRDLSTSTAAAGSRADCSRMTRSAARSPHRPGWPDHRCRLSPCARTSVPRGRPKIACAPWRLWTAQPESASGVDPRRIGVAGDSAVANLAVVVCQQQRRKHRLPIALQVLLCPVAG